MPQRYSPRPIADYRIKTVPSDIEEIMRNPRGESAWNLYWLGVPSIDNVLDTGADWWRFYRPIRGAGAAVIDDVLEDECLRLKLQMHPYAFSEWFARQPDHSIFECYEVLGGDRWVATVLARAEAAGARMTAEDPPMRIVGNVVQVNFRKVA